MSDSVTRFYDSLAADYHLVLADWHHSVRWQGEVLGRLIAAHLGPRRCCVLDCACGIGTQAIGLALRGHQVWGTDVSSAAVERARHEAAVLNAQVDFAVADMRELSSHVEGHFDVVIACDNALPHLLTDDDLRAAAAGILAKLAGGGLFLATIRDYDQLRPERPEATLPRVLGQGSDRRVVFQTWEWDDNRPTYRMTQFLVCRTGDGWRTTSHETWYRALRRDELTNILEETGFEDVRWLGTDESGYYQPVVTGRRPSEERRRDA